MTYRFGLVFVLLCVTVAAGCDDTEVSCGEDFVDCDGRCVDVEIDENNCGECGVVCGDGESCVDGACVLVCPSGLEVCDDRCVDVGVDPDHCGGCDTACADGEVCSDGECALSCGGSTPTLCDGGCVDTEVDEAHCGGCGNPCEPGEHCLDGECTDQCVASAEICDGEDNDCDGDVDEADAVDAATWYADADDDGYGDPDDSLSACSQPEGFIDDAGDCDDGDASVNPGGEEVCDGVDNDCDGLFDEEADAADLSTWYADRDGDGYGDPAVSIEACEAPFDFFVANDGDCDDSDGANSPDGVEVCDGVDNDCDELVDDADDDTDPATMSLFFLDDDGDGSGGVGTALACAPYAGLVETSDDCDDGDDAVHPAADELCNLRDDDCDGEVDEDVSDGFEWYVDADQDTFGDASVSLTACERPVGYVMDDTDCDDGSRLVHPYAWEVMGNDIDDDCDGGVDGDDTDVVNTLTLDDDETRAITFSSFVYPFCGEDRSGGWLDSNGRFMFFDGVSSPEPAAWRFRQAGPAVTSLWADFDPRIGGTFAWIEYDDAVGFYFRNVSLWGLSGLNTHSLVLLTDGTALTQWEDLDVDDIDGLTGFSCGLTEGEEIDVSEHPIARYSMSIGAGTEPALYEQFDRGSNDLEGLVRRFTATAGVDADGDGWTDLGGDPDDSDPTLIGGDADNDGFAGPTSGGDDCDDSDPTINPGMGELCNGMDDDCDGEVDEDFLWAYDADGDGYGDPDGPTFYSCTDPGMDAVNDATDCDDTDPTIAPLSGDTFGDGIDGDCDGVDGEAGWLDDTTYFAWVRMVGLTWRQADDACQSAGYDGLASIRDADEQAFVTAMNAEDVFRSNHLVWLGYSDAREEDSWQWVDGGDPTYTNWNDSEPNGGTSANCAEMSPASGLWNDISCTLTRNFSLCQLRL